MRRWSGSSRRSMGSSRVAEDLPFLPSPYGVGEGARALARAGGGGLGARITKMRPAAGVPARSGRKPPPRPSSRSNAPPPLRGRGKDLHLLPSLTEWGRVPERGEGGRGRPGSQHREDEAGRQGARALARAGGGGLGADTPPLCQRASCPCSQTTCIAMPCPQSPGVRRPQTRPPYARR